MAGFSKTPKKEDKRKLTKKQTPSNVGYVLHNFIIIIIYYFRRISLHFKGGGDWGVEAAVAGRNRLDT